MSDLLLIEKDGPCTTILTLNRPEKRNALNLALMKELCQAIKAIGQDKQQRVLILRGAGSVFCAGLDLAEASTPKNINASARMVAQTLLAIHECPLVTIASVHGAAIAGGAGLMSACDFAVATEDARIGYPEVRRGLVAALVLTFLRRQLNERAIRELLLVAELITAERALRMGLVTRVVTSGNLTLEVQSLAQSILQGAPSALVQTKRILDHSWPRSIRQDLNRTLKEHLKARHSKECKEGIAAFLEKRSPSWAVGQNS